MNVPKTQELIQEDSKPDIAKDDSSHLFTLNKVGMNNVELPIMITDDIGRVQTIPARCDLFVSLDDASAKGIHMSRLYLKAKEVFSTQTFSTQTLSKLSQDFIDSHKDLSNSSFIKVSFDYMVERAALKSSQKGWRFYPVELGVNNQAGILNFEFDIELTYSSTCPCSAALARQINQKSFLLEFANKPSPSKEEISEWLSSMDSQTAVPHAQRSKANIKLCFDSEPENVDPIYWINKLEDALMTPVQAAVKREDEQEFARLNGSNMMFSEDACRRLKAALEKEKLSDYKVLVEHHESLHPHNAVAIASKN